MAEAATASIKRTRSRQVIDLGDTVRLVQHPDGSITIEHRNLRTPLAFDSRRLQRYLLRELRDTIL